MLTTGAGDRHRHVGNAEPVCQVGPGDGQLECRHGEGGPLEVVVGSADDDLPAGALRREMQAR